MKAFFFSDDEGYGVTVIADTKEEAIEEYGEDIANEMGVMDISEVNYRVFNIPADQKVLRMFGKGIVEGEEGIHYGLYDWVEDMECPVCHKVTMVYHKEIGGEHIVACEECMAKIEGE